MLGKKLVIGTAALLALTTAGPRYLRAQESSGNAALQAGAANIPNAVNPDIPVADLEDRRQEIVVSSMHFANDRQKSRFLEVYAPYDMKLKGILAGKRKLMENYMQEQQNGVIGDADAAKIINAALSYDRRREEALAAYIHQLKTVMPEQQALRAYQIENRIHALYAARVTESIPLTR